MDALNTLRAVLVAGTFLLTILLAFDGQWLPTAILSVGILAHLGLWVHLYRQRQQTAERRAALEGTPPPVAG
jgi:hypothetical protein